MNQNQKIFWMIMPPRGDNRLQMLRARLFSSGILKYPAPPPAWAWKPSAPEETPDIKSFQELLPLYTKSWRLENGTLWLDIAGKDLHELDLLGTGEPEYRGFCFGPATSLPQFLEPMSWQSLRLVEWSWQGPPPWARSESFDLAQGREIKIIPRTMEK